jgi:hypothetical protein
VFPLPLGLSAIELRDLVIHISDTSAVAIDLNAISH